MGGGIEKVAVIGTGTLGTQIAIQAAAYGYQVKIYDKDPGMFQRVYQGFSAMLNAGNGKPTVAVEAWDKAAATVERCESLEKAVGDADLVIEAVNEKVELKRAVFAEIDGLAPKGAILATNSSSIPISRIESATTRRERCLNIHFYQPARGMNMVDIMGGTRTAPEVFEAGKAWIRSIGCIPLTVKKEILGFCFNRVWRAIKRETLYMWAEGFVDFRDIDRAWMVFTGNAQGPFGKMDAVGLDVVYDIEMVYYNESKDPRDHPPKPLKEMVDRGELGVKSGRGFYTYPNPEYGKVDFLKG